MKFLATIVLIFGLLFVNSHSVAQQSAGDSNGSVVDAKTRPFIGIQMEDVDNGIAVASLIPGSPADKAGIKVDDVLVELNGTKLAGREILVSELSKNKVGETVKLLIQRNGKEIGVSVVLGNISDFISSPAKAELPKTFEVKSADGLLVTVDAYTPVSGDAPSIVLCHQAGWSRGEYQEIAPKLNEMGFNCYAIDQRSGGGVNDVVNETNKRAVDQEKGVAFLDAEQDIVAALKLARSMSGKKGKVILWGSSYSAALSLRIAGEHPDLVDGVLAFAPGEYFKRFGKPGDWIQTSAKNIKAPAFITSAKNEHKNWKSIYEAIPGESKAMFVPETKGNHGSRALWEKFDDHESYWDSTSKFLSQFVEDDDSEQEHSNEEKK